MCKAKLVSYAFFGVSRKKYILAGYDLHYLFKQLE